MKTTTILLTVALVSFLLPNVSADEGDDEKVECPNYGIEINAGASKCSNNDFSEHYYQYCDPGTGAGAGAGAGGSGKNDAGAQATAGSQCNNGNNNGSGGTTT